MQSASDIARPAGAFVPVCATAAATVAKKAKKIPTRFML
jgi:hypothetical protein